MLTEIKNLAERGWKEFPIHPMLDTHDRSFFKERIELRMWDFNKYGREIGWDIVARKGDYKITVQIVFENLDEAVEKLLKVLEHVDGSTED
jgi:hypothetical protein